MQLIPPVPPVNDVVRPKARFGRQGTFVIHRPFGHDLCAVIQTTRDFRPAIRQGTRYAREGRGEAVGLLDDTDEQPCRRQEEAALAMPANKKKDPRYAGIYRDMPGYSGI